MRRLTVLVCATLLLMTACGFDTYRGSASAREPPSLLRVPGTPAELRVEIANGPEERARGLMGRTSLDADRGMAFLFEEPVINAFWMKNTRIPLSIAFWDADARIVDVLEMTPCPEDPCPIYRPGAPYVGAVEANAGYFAKHGVRIGDEVELREIADA